MVNTTRHVLTRGDKTYARKRQEKQVAREVVFDDSKREDYLTGFHKRKVARRDASVARAKEREREERIAERARIRQERKQELEEQLNAFNKRLHGDDDEDEDEEADGSGEEQAQEWYGFPDPPRPSKGVLKYQRSNSNSEEDEEGDDACGDVTTTVVIQDMTEPPKEILKQSLEKADMAAQHLRLINQLSQHPRRSSKKKSKPKKRYLDRAERKANVARERLRHKSKRGKDRS